MRVSANSGGRGRLRTVPEASGQVVELLPEPKTLPGNRGRNTRWVRSMSSDTLSEVLRAVRLTGAVFFAVDASAPWVADTPDAREVGPHIMPGLEHVIEYHAIVEGACWGGRLDETPIRLEPGDVILLPPGRPPRDLERTGHARQRRR